MNCVIPGAILVERDIRHFLALQSSKRRLTPVDIARACLFPAGELSDGMTGQTLNVDGGWHMH